MLQLQSYRRRASQDLSVAFAKPLQRDLKTMSGQGTFILSSILAMALTVGGSGNVITTSNLCEFGLQLWPFMSLA